YENYNDYDLDFNIQVLINFFYSIIETTDGIYSLTYDKNVGSINALSRIQYESVIQFLTMIEGDFRENILSYEYHQIKDLVQKNEYLISVNKKFSESHFKVEQQKWKKALQDKRFQNVKKKIRSEERRVGKECRSKRAPKHYRKNKKATKSGGEKSAIHAYKH